MAHTAPSLHGRCGVPTNRRAKCLILDLKESSPARSSTAGAINILEELRQEKTEPRYEAAFKETMSAPDQAKCRIPTCTSSTSALPTVALTRQARVTNTATSATPVNMPAPQNQAMPARMKEAILCSSEERTDDIMRISQRTIFAERE